MRKLEFTYVSSNLWYSSMEMHSIHSSRIKTDFRRCFQNFQFVSSFGKTHTAVVNKDLIELVSWYSHKLKLHCDMFKANRAKLVTITQKLIRNTNVMTKFRDVRVPEPANWTRFSMEMSGEPSTWFPLGALVERPPPPLEHFSNFRDLSKFSTFRPKITTFRNH